MICLAIPNRENSSDCRNDAKTSAVLPSGAHTTAPPVKYLTEISKNLFWCLLTKEGPAKSSERTSIKLHCETYIDVTYGFWFHICWQALHVLTYLYTYAPILGFQNHVQINNFVAHHTNFVDMCRIDDSSLTSLPSSECFAGMRITCCINFSYFWNSTSLFDAMHTRSPSSIFFSARYMVEDWKESRLLSLMCHYGVET